MSRKLILILGLLVASLAFAEPAFAAAAGGQRTVMPWEAPLANIQASLTGPVASAIAIGAVAVAGGMLIFGGELNDFARRMMYLVLVGGLLLGANTIASMMGATGASIGTPPIVGTVHPLATTDG